MKSKKELVEKIKSKITFLIDKDYRIHKVKENNILSVDNIRIDGRYGFGVGGVKIRDIEIDLQREDVKELYDFLDDYYIKQNDRIVINYLNNEI